MIVEMRAKLYLCVVLLLAPVARAETPRSFNVPDHGTLHVTAPQHWTDRMEAPRGLPPTVELTDSKNKMLLLLTPLWSSAGDPQFNTAEAIRAGIERAAHRAQESSVEKELPLREIETADGKGYYFSATDRAPAEGEYEYMAGGAVPVGDLVVSFTVLTHVAPPEGIAEALAIVRTATQKK